MKKIGVIGAGISGLTAALNLLKNNKINQSQKIIKIFEIQSHPGGRIYSPQISSSSSSKQKLTLDIGANLIDFQSQVSQKTWNELLPTQIAKNINKFQRPFLIFEDKGKIFRKGDYDKNRYYYMGGFGKFIGDIVQEIKKLGGLIYYEKEVIIINEAKEQNKNNKNNNCVELEILDKKTNIIQTQQFDHVFISCPAPKALKILTHPNSSQSQSQPNTFSQLIEYYKHIHYTVQLSIALTITPTFHNFSCILFKDHPIITFICSHQQKYGQDSIIIQCTQNFSQMYYRESDGIIKQKVMESLPKDIRDIVLNDLQYVHRWPNKSQIQSVPIHPKITLIGDSITGKSRVSNAVQSTKMSTSKL